MSSAPVGLPGGRKGGLIRGLLPAIGCWRSSFKKKRVSVVPLYRENARLIAEMTAKYRGAGAFCSLGRLTPVLGLTHGDVRAIGLEHGIVATVADAPDDRLLVHEAEFLKAIGYAESLSLDISDYEGADFVFDMNSPQTPQHLCERFDFIYNNGTIEHIFNVPNVLANIHNMLRPGGVVMHSVPVNNHLDHGFYQLSPTLFWDFYSANDYAELDAIMIRRDSKAFGLPWLQWGDRPYNPYRLPRPDLHDGKLDSGVYIMVFAARKVAASTGHRTPQQGCGRATLG